MLLPLDSPHWHDLSACWSAPRAIELLRQIVSTGRLGEAWQELQEEIIHQGTVYGVTSAALPHLIRLAPLLTPDEQRELWIDVAFMVTAGADSFDGNEPVSGMQETLTQSLRDAEPLALQAFLASPSLDEGMVSYYALACVALSGHAVGDAMWEFLVPGDGYIRLTCPECGAEYEVMASATRCGRRACRRPCRRWRRGPAPSGRACRLTFRPASRDSARLPARSPTPACWSRHPRPRCGAWWPRWWRRRAHCRGRERYSA